MNKTDFNNAKQYIIDHLRDGWVIRAVPKKVYIGTYEIEFTLRNMNNIYGRLTDYYEDIGEIQYT